jgi:hypothetical protein
MSIKPLSGARYLRRQSFSVCRRGPFQKETKSHPQDLAHRRMAAVSLPRDRYLAWSKHPEYPLRPAKSCSTSETNWPPKKPPLPGHPAAPIHGASGLSSAAAPLQQMCLLSHRLRHRRDLHLLALYEEAAAVVSLNILVLRGPPPYVPRLDASFHGISGYSSGRWRYVRSAPRASPSISLLNSSDPPRPLDRFRGAACPRSSVYSQG